MKAGVRFVCALVAAFILVFSAFSPAQAQNIGKVYLMRGLANIFSLGMDTLAEKLRQRGVDAQVYEYGQWPQLADEAVAWSRARGKAPIIIIGHSLGADTAIEMAERMTKLGLPPRLVFTFDPVGVTQVANTGGKFINYYQSNNGFGKRLTTGPGFKGQLVNRNLDAMGAIDHFNIEKSDALHAEVVSTILSVTRRRSRPRPAPAPEVSAPAAKPAAASAADTVGATTVHAVSQPAVR